MVTVRLAAGLRMAWDRRWLTRPDLGALRAKARKLERAKPEGDAPWRLALERLVDSLETEAQINEIGLTFAYVQLSDLLRQRARAERLWRRHPEILELPIERPIVVLGQMRSGTTRLQRLLGCDERLTHTHFHEVMSPAARVPALAVAKSAAQIALLDFLSPATRAVHPTSATAVEEAYGLLSLSFYGAHFEAQWRIPGFTRWWEGEDRAAVYRDFKRYLQTLAWRRCGPTRPWVLKAPQFMEDLDALLAVFPDARLICLQRPAEDVVASSASLVWHQMSLQSNHADRQWIGAEWLRKTALRQAACNRVRAARADVPQLETGFADVNDDWRAEMRRIYDFLDLPLTVEVERKMARYLRRAEGSGFRNHAYDPSDFGLTAERVRGALGA
ncbi:MAG: sulfotransferase family protein [Croceibacterium sp.]